MLLLEAYNTIYTEVYTLANPSGIAEGRRDEGVGGRKGGGGKPAYAISDKWAIYVYPSHKY